MSGRQFIVITLVVLAVGVVAIAARALQLPDASLYPLFIAGVAALVMLRRRTSV